MCVLVEFMSLGQRTRDRQFHQHLKNTCYCDYVKNLHLKCIMFALYVVSHTQSATKQILLHKKCGPTVITLPSAQQHKL